MDMDTDKERDSLTGETSFELDASTWAAHAQKIQYTDADSSESDAYESAFSDFESMSEKNGKISDRAPCTTVASVQPETSST